jgi:uncharacterized protein
MTPVQLLVIAKSPVPGRVKTRLCPPCTPAGAALLAGAALADTLDTVSRTPATDRVLVVDGGYRPPPGWLAVAQRGDGLGARLANAYADTAAPGVPSLLVGMDTPQLTVAVLTTAARLLADTDAVLGAAADGGWWALGLRDPAAATVLREVPMSTADTHARTLAALRRRGLRVAPLPVLRDVDTAADAHAVAALCPPGSRFATAVPRLVADLVIR